MTAADPLLTPFTFKNLTLRNRIVSTSHEPAYSEDGCRYRAYHVAKARGGVGLTMIGGSALVSRDSSPAFGNLQLWKDEAWPWLRRLADEVHDEGATVMIQLTHLGHRTSNYTQATRLPAHLIAAVPAMFFRLSGHLAHICSRAATSGFFKTVTSRRGRVPNASLAACGRQSDQCLRPGTGRRQSCPLTRAFSVRTADSGPSPRPFATPRRPRRASSARPPPAPSPTGPAPRAPRRW